MIGLEFEEENILLSLRANLFKKVSLEVSGGAGCPPWGASCAVRGECSTWNHEVWGIL